MAAPKGFEPSIFGVTGRRPLQAGPRNHGWRKRRDSNPHLPRRDPGRQPGARPLDDVSIMVLPAGFEPAIFAVRGQRPKPLDDGSKVVEPSGIEPEFHPCEGGVFTFKTTAPRG